MDNYKKSLRNRESTRDIMFLRQIKRDFLYWRLREMITLVFVILGK